MESDWKATVAPTGNLIQCISLLTFAIPTLFHSPTSHNDHQAVLRMEATSGLNKSRSDALGVDVIVLLSFEAGKAVPNYMVGN